MTDSEQREAARQFVNRWAGRGKEDEHGRSYWIELLTKVLGMDDATERIDFEKKVVIDGNTKRIDVYIPETRVIIEQKSLGIALDHKLHNSGDIDLTPFEQADRYNSKLTFDERARWIVTCNFAEIWIYDMNQQRPEPVKLALEELPNKYSLLSFLVKKEVKQISHEIEVSIQAGSIVGLIYDAFLEQYKIPDIPEKDETAEQRARREHKLKSLNALCVRLVFCLYAEDAGIFGKRDMFHDYLEGYEVKDCRRALIELFRILDTPITDRDEYLEAELAQFPYVNGGLFKDEDIEIPPFTEEIKQMLLTKASEDFDWRNISPTIFGAVFESTLNPETRRSGGMHYTSIENIHKVIDPLFMDELNKEFEEISAIEVKKTRDSKLDAFQAKLAALVWLDPACGSGNFLTETYLSVRRLENKLILRRMDGQMSIGEARNPIKVSIQQFYGIEINDFAATVAKTALWIAESQMLEETKAIVYGFNDDFLPLKTYVNIVEGNALRLDWNAVVPADRLSFIMGNPPFVGARWMSQSQKEDIANIFKGWKTIGDLDYVSCWYKKAADYMSQNTSVETALVSTNSITQGESVAILWKPLFEMGVQIDFAHRTFRWDSEAKIKAHVHCVIIGFSMAKGSAGGKAITVNNSLEGSPNGTVSEGNKENINNATNNEGKLYKNRTAGNSKVNENTNAAIRSNDVAVDIKGKNVKTDISGVINSGDHTDGNGRASKNNIHGTDKIKKLYIDDECHIVSNINGYLLDAENIFIERRTNPISDVPPIALGGQAIDGGFYILTEEERDALLNQEPQAKPFIRHYMMGRDFINRKPRYCIWLVGAAPSLLKKCPLILKRVEAVREFRNKSNRSNTKRAAENAALFATIVEHDGQYIAIPKVSSENRRYIPMDYLSGEIIPGDKLFTMPDATMYHFGVLTSNVHMAWMRAVCGRLKSDYSYSNTIVYNNFPWAKPTPEQKARIEQTAQGILDARALYPDASLADLYDPLTMPKELRKAHTDNDKAVMAAYGFSTKMSEADCVAALMKMYQEMTSQ